MSGNGSNGSGDASSDYRYITYETYDDGWFGYKAAFEAFIGVRDAISRASENTQQISTNVRDQSRAVDNVLRSMTDFGGNVKVTAATLSQGRSRAEALQETVAGLSAII